MAFFLSRLLAPHFFFETFFPLFWFQTFSFFPVGSDSLHALDTYVFQLQDFFVDPPLFIDRPELEEFFAAPYAAMSIRWCPSLLPSPRLIVATISSDDRPPLRS